MCMDAQPLLITIAEAARRLSVSSDTIRRMIAKGELPMVRIGRLVRIPAEAVDRLAGQG